MVNFKASGAIPENLDWHQRKKILKDVNHYVWVDPQLFKTGVDNLFKVCGLYPY